MDDFEQRPGEGLISYAIRRDNLPPSDPKRLSPAMCEKLIRAGIAQVERRSAAAINALKKAGLGNAKV